MKTVFVLYEQDKWAVDTYIKAVTTNEVFANTWIAEPSDFPDFIRCFDEVDLLDQGETNA